MNQHQPEGDGGAWPELDQLEDWVLENSTEDACLLWQVPLCVRVFEPNLGDSECKHQALAGVSKLLNGGFIALGNLRIADEQVSEVSNDIALQLMADEREWEKPGVASKYLAVYFSTPKGEAFNSWRDSEGFVRASTQRAQLRTLSKLDTAGNRLHVLGDGVLTKRYVYAKCSIAPDQVVGAEITDPFTTERTGSVPGRRQRRHSSRQAKLEEPKQ